ncbi:hypothetical protein HPB50_022422 [Hyalomma asiaticum]|uniref:Uncharacterized protein n=1 Tax=Hyalomma asiaticum TaxID=266040 RepID=A0ACB7TBH8_HYAAI|nr:hypothetical protein HPB50_022422 [Hyalomma asiaticum]
MVLFFDDVTTRTELKRMALQHLLQWARSHATRQYASISTLLPFTVALQRLVLLRDTCQSHFQLRRVDKPPHMFPLPPSSQERINCLQAPSDKEVLHVYHIQVGFKSSMYATFVQTLAFDFGGCPVLIRNLNVDMVAPDMLSTIERSGGHFQTGTRRWSVAAIDLVQLKERARTLWEKLISTCSHHGSLYNMRWGDIKYELQGFELAKLYDLNPQAKCLWPERFLALVLDERQGKLCLPSLRSYPGLPASGGTPKPPAAAEATGKILGTMFNCNSGMNLHDTLVRVSCRFGEWTTLRCKDATTWFFFSRAVIIVVILME